MLGPRVVGMAVGGCSVGLGMAVGMVVGGCSVEMVVVFSCHARRRNRRKGIRFWDLYLFLSPLSFLSYLVIRSKTGGIRGEKEKNLKSSQDQLQSSLLLATSPKAT